MVSQIEPVFIFGASGHAKVIIDMIEKQRLFKITFIVDDNLKLKGNMIEGYPIIGGKEELLQRASRGEKGIIAIGDNDARYSLGEWLEHRNYELITLIHPSAQIANSVVIGRGSVVMANAVINSASVIGKNVIVNTGANIDHDCIIKDCVHVAPGTTLCGNVKIGEKTFVGAGSTIIQNISIEKNVSIGAGTTVYKNISENMSIVGHRVLIEEEK